MTKYAIEDGLPIPAPNPGGRPPLERLAERDEKILNELAQGMEFDEVIEANMPDYLPRGSENWHQYKKDLKKRITNKINSLSK
ncbi:hypothetical protein [Thiobacillus sp. 65-1402]|uniref:hypothetical protein n=1 Tax=Thiobacillus sp. 65-1402 TaxID=1895861 RepID=UPI0025FE2FCF|nr:hypothetical protein [Thiobacillus sp. 65-1402]